LTPESECQTQAHLHCVQRPGLPLTAPVTAMAGIRFVTCRAHPRLNGFASRSISGTFPYNQYQFPVSAPEREKKGYRRIAMLKISEVLRVKGNILYTATPDQSVAQAIATMSERDIGSLVIMEQGQLTGMLTFREIIRHMHDSPGSLENTTIRKIMDDAPVSVSPNTEAEEVRRLMLEHHARYVPVMDGPVLMGVISFYDMARAMLEASKFENKMLKAYIRDWPGEPEDEKD
jgi:CBS domain-containing protein